MAMRIHIAGVVLAVLTIAELVAFFSFSDTLKCHLSFGGAALQLGNFIFKV